MFCFCDTASYQYDFVWMLVLIYTFATGGTMIDDWNFEDGIHVVFPVDQA
jgi:hypothetical protein